MSSAPIEEARRLADSAQQALSDPQRCAPLQRIWEELERAWDLADAPTADADAVRIDVVGTMLWLWTPVALTHGEQIRDHVERGEWFRGLRALVTASLAFLEREAVAGNVAGLSEDDVRHGWHAAHWADARKRIDRAFCETLS